MRPAWNAYNLTNLIPLKDRLNDVRVILLPSSQDETTRMMAKRLEPSYVHEPKDSWKSLDAAFRQIFTEYVLK